MPFTPFGASGRRASTRWMTLPPKSWSPEEMKILVPVIAKLPSPFGTARVASRPRSVPAEDSVSAMAPVHSPEIIFGRYVAFSSSLGVRGRSPRRRRG